MANKSAAVSVGTSATRLDQGQTDFETVAEIAVYNNSTQIVYVGDANVTTATGIPVSPATATAPTASDGGFYSETFHDPDDHLYGVVASGTAEVRVRQVGI